jgi:hypothetical protein
MKTKMLGMFVAAACLSLVGCATVVPPKDGRRLAVPRKDKATVYLICTYGGIALGAEPMMVDGKNIGGLNRRQYTWFYLPPGEHEITINDPSIPSRKLAGQRQLFTTGKTYYLAYGNYGPSRSDGALLFDAIRQGVTGQQGIAADPMPELPEEIALRVIQPLKLVGNRLQ